MYQHLQFFNVTRSNDTLLIEPGHYNLYLSNEKTDYNVQYWPGSKTRIKVAISNIDYIKVDRKIKDIMQPLQYIGAISALFVAPLISLGKSFNSDRYYLVAGSSVCLFAFSLTIDRIFGQKIYRLKPHKKRTVWTID